MRAAKRVCVPSRDRILEHGPGVLSDAELLALLLGDGASGRAELLASRLLWGGLTELRKLGPGGPDAGLPLTLRQLSRVCAALELGRRVAHAELPKRRRLLRGDALCALFAPRLAHLQHEEFWAVLMTARLEEVRSVQIARGGHTSCSVLPREAFLPALLHAAPAVAFVHNHPSGEPSPSPDDQRLQMLLEETGRMLGIRVVDHLVVSERGHHSARDGAISPEQIAEFQKSGVSAPKPTVSIASTEVTL